MKNKQIRNLSIIWLIVQYLINMASSEDIKDEYEDIMCLESPSLQDIKDAAKNIASKAIKTPLVKLNQRSRSSSRNNSNVSSFFYTLE